MFKVTCNRQVGDSEWSGIKQVPMFIIDDQGNGWKQDVERIKEIVPDVIEDSISMVDIGTSIVVGGQRKRSK